eukprot:1182112-Prorocentrum_minimum.AAC.2
MVRISCRPLLITVTSPRSCSPRHLARGGGRGGRRGGSGGGQGAKCGSTINRMGDEFSRCVE